MAIRQKGTQLPFPKKGERENTTALTLSKYKPGLLALAAEDFYDRRNRSVIEKRYCTKITKGRQENLDLVAQDRYLKGRAKALKKLLKAYGENTKKVASALSAVATYDVVAVAEVLPSLIMHLGIAIPAPPVIDYRDESLNLQHLIPDAWRGYQGFLSSTFPGPQLLEALRT